jgi:hypothetical protein
MGSTQGCQIFLGTTYQNRKSIPNHYKINQMSIKYIGIPNGCQIEQMSIKYIEIFRSKTLQKLPKFVFLVWKFTFLQPCVKGGWWKSNLMVQTVERIFNMHWFSFFSTNRPLCSWNDMYICTPKPCPFNTYIHT